MEIYASARKHGIADDDITHAIEHAEIVIHAMPMRAKYQPFLRGQGESNV